MGSIRSGHSTPTPGTPDTSRTNMLPEVSPNNAVSLSCMVSELNNYFIYIIINNYF